MKKALQIASAISDLRDVMTLQSFNPERDLPEHAKKILDLTELTDQDKQAVGRVVGFISARRNTGKMANQVVSTLLTALAEKINPQPEIQ